MAQGFPSRPLTEDHSGPSITHAESFSATKCPLFIPAAALVVLSLAAHPMTAALARVPSERRRRCEATGEGNPVPAALNDAVVVVVAEDAARGGGWRNASRPPAEPYRPSPPSKRSLAVGVMPSAGPRDGQRPVRSFAGPAHIVALARAGRIRSSWYRRDNLFEPHLPAMHTAWTLTSTTECVYLEQITRHAFMDWADACFDEWSQRRTETEATVAFVIAQMEQLGRAGLAALASTLRSAIEADGRRERHVLLLSSALASLVLVDEPGGRASLSGTIEPVRRGTLECECAEGDRRWRLQNEYYPRHRHAFLDAYEALVFKQFLPFWHLLQRWIGGGVTDVDGRDAVAAAPTSQVSGSLWRDDVDPFDAVLNVCFHVTPHDGRGDVGGVAIIADAAADVPCWDTLTRLRWTAAACAAWTLSSQEVLEQASVVTGALETVAAWERREHMAIDRLLTTWADITSTERKIETAFEAHLAASGGVVVALPVSVFRERWGLAAEEGHLRAKLCALHALGHAAAQSAFLEQSEVKSRQRLADDGAGFVVWLEAVLRHIGTRPYPAAAAVGAPESYPDLDNATLGLGAACARHAKAVWNEFAAAAHALRQSLLVAALAGVEHDESRERRKVMGVPGAVVNLDLSTCGGDGGLERQHARWLSNLRALRATHMEETSARTAVSVWESELRSEVKLVRRLEMSAQLESEDSSELRRFERSHAASRLAMCHFTGGPHVYALCGTVNVEEAEHVATALFMTKAVHQRSALPDLEALWLQLVAFHEAARASIRLASEADQAWTRCACHRDEDRARCGLRSEELNTRQRLLHAAGFSARPPAQRRLPLVAEGDADVTFVLRMSQFATNDTLLDFFGAE